ncbi:MAG: nucleotidyltransferase family protein [Actinomycetia bacterium]|nr:nucleotidyltransferase family protein [Actinomycetes bacterium]
MGRPVDTIETHELRLGLSHRLHGLILVADRESNGRLVEEAPTELKRSLAVANVKSKDNYDRALSTIRILRANFEREDLPLRIVKGAAVATLLYPVPWARPFEDVDVVLDPIIDRRLDRVLRRLGMATGRIDAIRRLQGRRRPLHEFTPPAGDLGIDIHFNPFGLLDRVRNPQLLLSAFEQINAGPLTQVFVPAPALATVISALNLARKGGDSLFHAADLARMFRTDRVDWKLVDAIGTAEGVGHVVDSVVEAVVQDLDLDRPRPDRTPVTRPWWAPNLGEIGVGHSLLRRGPVVTLRRPMTHLPAALRAFASWYMPGPTLLDARGVPAGSYPLRLVRFSRNHLADTIADRVTIRAMV